MHPTLRAPRLAIALTFALCLASSYGVGQSEQQVLDLTEKSASEIRSMGIPGQSAGGVLGEPQKSGYELPIRLDIKHFRLKGNSVTLQLRLTNIGAVPLRIPSCLDGHKAFRPGAVDRRSLEFGLVVESPTADRHIVEPVKITFGSSQGCSTQLEPDHTLLVIIDARIPERILDISKQNVRVPAKIFVAEAKFDDDHYNVKNRSGRVESQPIEISF